MASFPKTRIALILATTVVAHACTQPGEDAEAAQMFLEESAALVDRFQGELKQELGTALKEAGPVGAIGVCQSAAPAIGQKLSDESGALVQRIARRHRNPSGAVSVDLDGLYSQLENAPLENGVPRAVHASLDDGYVYMRAIPMQDQPCTMCHGTNISPEIQAAIAQVYPEDSAINFNLGDLRGAFVVRQSEKE